MCFYSKMSLGIITKSLHNGQDDDIITTVMMTALGHNDDTCNGHGDNTRSGRRHLHKGDDILV